MGAKIRLNGTSKVNRQTNRQTDRQTDRRTFRLIESIDPEGRCFENVHIHMSLELDTQKHKENLPVQSADNEKCIQGSEKDKHSLS